MDAPTLLSRDGNEYVFVSGRTVYRVGLDGSIRRQRRLSSHSGDFALLADGHTMLHVIPYGAVASCASASARFELVDTLSTAPPRVIGRIESDGYVRVAAMALQADDSLTVRLERYSAEDDELTTIDVRVTPRTSRIRPVRLGNETQAAPALRHAARPEVEPQRAMRVATDVEGERPRVVVRDREGRVRVQVTGPHELLSPRISPDGRHLLLITYANHNADYLTGTAPRLEAVDLTTGDRRTLVGEGSGITDVEGIARVVCELRVDDPESALNVRAGPSTSAEVIGSIPHGAQVNAVRQRGRWRRIEAPVAGWVYAENLDERCTVAE